MPAPVQPKFPNASVKDMNEREQAAFEGAIPVNETGTLRFIRQAEGEKPAFGTITKHTGVVAQYNEKTKFQNPGKAK